MTARLRPSKGLQYLQTLLEAPGREVHVAELAGVQIVGDAGVILDDRPAARISAGSRHCRPSARRPGGGATSTASARAEDEIDFITRELTTAFGLGGRARKAADTGERARKAVTNRIKDTIAKIEAVHPTLGRHLANCVRTGAFCAYEPERPIEWQV